MFNTADSKSYKGSSLLGVYVESTCKYLRIFRSSELHESRLSTCLWQSSTHFISTDPITFVTTLSSLLPGLPNDYLCRGFAMKAIHVFYIFPIWASCPFYRKVPYFNVITKYVMSRCATRFIFFTHVTTHCVLKYPQYVFFHHSSRQLRRKSNFKTTWLSVRRMIQTSQTNWNVSNMRVINSCYFLYSINISD